jgi:hypothetical protein
VRSLALDAMANLELPAFEYLGLATQLALELRLQALRGVRIGTAAVRRNHRMRAKVRPGVIALRQTEDLMQQDPMPATETVQHVWLVPFLEANQREVKAGPEWLIPSE